MPARPGRFARRQARQRGDSRRPRAQGGAQPAGSAQGAARRSPAQRRARPRQAIPRRVVRRREGGLRGRRVQLHFPHRRRRRDLDAVVRSHRQPEIPEPVRDPPGRRRCVHRRRSRSPAQARSGRRSASAPSNRYQGTLLGVAGNAAAVLVFGLRGNAYRSDDAGRTLGEGRRRPARHHRRRPCAAGGGFVLADVSGRLSASTDGARSGSRCPLPPR